MNKKKAIVLTTVPSTIEQFNMDNIKQLQSLGYQVDVASNFNVTGNINKKRFEEFKKELKELNVKYHNISFSRNPFSKDNIKACKQTRELLKENDYDLIHCHTPICGAITRLEAKKIKSKARVIYTAHGFHFYKGAPLKNWILFYPIEKYFSKYTDCLITINQEDYNLAKKKLKAKNIELVHGIGVDTNKFDFEMSDKEKSDFRKSLNLKEDDFVMTIVGELNKNKNQIMAINAMKKLKKENANYKLLLVGQGSLKEEYENKIKEYDLQDNVFLLGYRNDVSKILKISNVLISLSHREGLGLNVAEAMYIGLPVIVTDNRGHRELVENNKNGFIINIEEELINNIKKMIKNKELNKKFGDFSKKKVEKYLDINVIEEMKKIYVSNIKKYNLLFIHTAEKIKCNSRGVCYTDGAYDEIVMRRYQEVSNDSMAFLARMDDKKYADEFITKKFNLIPKNIQIITIQNNLNSVFSYLNLNLHKQNNKIIEDTVKKSNRIIIRTPCEYEKKIIKYAKKYNVPYLVEIVGCPFDAYWNHSFKGKILAIPEYIRLKRIVKDSKYSVYVTSSFLQKRYPTEGKSLACSDVLLSSLNDEVFKNRLNKIEKNKDKIIIGTIGSISAKYKGQQYVIEAISNLIKKGYNIEYQLVGNGDKKYLNRFVEKYNVKKNIAFKGPIPHEEIYNWLDNIDIYIQPSTVEGLCRALIEAMSRACPCIASNVGGNPELLNKKFIFEKKNVNDLEEKIIRLIEKKSMIKSAEENFNESKEYDVDKLNKKRRSFMNEFMMKG